MFKTSFAGNFVETMQARQESWSAQGNISAAIQIPPELIWVLYQENGVGEHPIDASAGRALVLPGPIFREHVDWVPRAHTQGTHSIGTVAAGLSELLHDLLPDIFSKANYDAGLARELFITQIMPKVKAAIVEQLSIDLSNLPREQVEGFPAQGGKLHGRVASEVFDEESSIVDKS